MSTIHETLPDWLEAMQAEIAARDAALLQKVAQEAARKDTAKRTTKYEPAQWE